MLHAVEQGEEKNGTRQHFNTRRVPLGNCVLKKRRYEQPKECSLPGDDRHIGLLLTKHPYQQWGASPAWTFNLKLFGCLGKHSETLFFFFESRSIFSQVQKISYVLCDRIRRRRDVKIYFFYTGWNAHAENGTPNNSWHTLTRQIVPTEPSDWTRAISWLLILSITVAGLLGFDGCEDGFL